MALTVELRRKCLKDIVILCSFYTWSIHVENLNAVVARQLNLWARENLPNTEKRARWKYHTGLDAYVFVNERDAALFFLTWHGAVIESDEYDY